MIEKNYLSDEELEKLILDVETENLIAAPPDLLNDILASLEKSKPPKVVNLQQKKAEFRRYCFRVISSMAAAIAFLILIPGISGMKESDVPSKESIVAENTQTREEVTGNNGKRIISAINESHVFSDIWDFNIFE